MERDAFVPSFGVLTTATLEDKDIDTFLGSDPDEVVNIEDEPKSKPNAKKTVKQIVQQDEEDDEEEETPQLKESDPDDILGEETDEDEEERPKAKVKPAKKVEEEEEKPTETEENIFSSLTNELKNLGVFNQIEGESEVKDGDTFKERFTNEINNRVETSLSNFISRFGEDYQEAFQAIYIDGVEPKEFFQYSNNIENLNELDMSIVDNQKQVIRQYYSSLGWASDKISAKIEKLENAGDLEEDATGYHQVLVQKEQSQLEEVRKKKAQEQFQRQQYEQQYQASINKILSDKLTKKDFDGIPVDQNFANQIGDYITINKYKAANGDLLTDFDLEILNLKKPENYEKKVKVAMLIKLLESDPTLSKITRKATSKEKEGIFSTLTRQKSTKVKQGEESYSSWGLTK